MLSTWGPPALPERGDREIDTLFASMGRFISSWEATEFELARLLATFIEQPDLGAAWQVYGEGRIFRERLSLLGQAASAWFVRRPDQFAEGNFDRIVSHATGMGDRRNEIGHGIVLDHSGSSTLGTLYPEETGPHFLLTPPFHTVRWHDDLGIPKFAYSSVEILGLDAISEALRLAIKAFRESLSEH